MHFFEKQRVGLIGQTSVSLQKILIFFMICNLFAFFSGGFIQFFLCLIGFIGAYKKKSCLLSIYFWANIAIIVFSLISVVTLLGSTGPSNDQYSSSSSQHYSNKPISRWEQHPLAATAHKFANWAVDFSSSESDVSSTESSSVYYSSSVESSVESSSVQSSTESSTESSDYYSSENNYNPWGPETSSSPKPSSSEQPQPQSEETYYDGRTSAYPVIGLIVGFLLIFIFAYLQAKALALAWRLRKLILLPSIPVLNEPTPTPAPTQPREQVHYFPQDNNSCAEPEPVQMQQPAPQPQQPYPSYYPYPYPQPYGIPQGMMMVPHQPTYWGQQPVFYSYPQQQPQPQSNGEKQ